MSATIDAMIITYNESLNLPHCLKALQGWTNRIFVIDSGSTDGTQQIAAKRQQTQLFVGDEPPPLRKTWRGKIEKIDGEWKVVTRRGSFGFVNADAHAERLSELAGTDTNVDGWWRVNRIEIVSLEPR